MRFDLRARRHCRQAGVRSLINASPLVGEGEPCQGIQPSIDALHLP